MPDNKPDNPMPEVSSPAVRKVLAWISWVLLIGSPSLAAYVAILGEGKLKTVLIVTLGLLGGFAAAIKSGLRNPFKPGITILVGGLLLVGGCAGSLDAAVRSVHTLQGARKLTGQQLATSARLKHMECLEKHGPKTQGYAGCIKSHREALRKWQTVIRPIVDATCQAGGAAIQTSRLVAKCKKEKTCLTIVLELLRPGVCAVSRGIRGFGHLLTDKGKAILAILGTFQGVICK